MTERQEMTLFAAFCFGIAGVSCWRLSLGEVSWVVSAGVWTYCGVKAWGMRDD